jgi:hypothetical protein
VALLVGPRAERWVIPPVGADAVPLAAVAVVGVAAGCRSSR